MAWKVVVLSAYLNPVLLRTSVSAGVSGYLLKDTETFSPVDVARRVAAGERVFDAPVIGMMSQAFVHGEEMGDPLTFRELQVLKLMGEGYANTEIASELGISSNTVKTYVKSLMQKLGVRNRTEAAVKGFSLKLI